jgi:hypothetical protein
VRLWGQRQVEQDGWQPNQSMLPTLRDLQGETKHSWLVSQATLVQFLLESPKKPLEIQKGARTRSNGRRLNPRKAELGNCRSECRSESGELGDRTKILEMPCGVQSMGNPSRNCFFA